jgi:hypothetical protein
MRDPQTYPEYMMQDAEREAEEERLARGALPPIQPTDEQRALMRATFAARAIEKALAGQCRYYTTTAKGRLAAEKVDAMQRAQLDATRESKP